MELTMCFGLNNKSSVCNSCPVSKECKHVIADSGIDAIADIFEIMLHQLPEGYYQDTTKEGIKASYVTGQITPSSKPLETVVGTVNLDGSINPMDPDNMAKKHDKFQSVIAKIQEQQKRG